MLGLHCYTGAFSSCDKWAAVQWRAGPFPAEAPPAAELGPWACRLQRLWPAGALVAVQALGLSEASGVFPEQGPNRGRLCCKLDAPPLDHQGSPTASVEAIFFSDTPVSLRGQVSVISGDTFQEAPVC